MEHHCNPGVEIEKAVAVDIFDHGAFAMIGYQRIAARIRRGKYLLVAFDKSLRARSWNRRQDLWQIHADSFSQHYGTPYSIVGVNGKKAARTTVSPNRRGKGEHVKVQSC